MVPWRRTRDPYRIWVSEIMLQQTQVNTALPYYRRFVARFPTLRALARAPESSVLAAWSGLGYYRRARHLHAAARTVVREHAGRVPDDPGRFGSLPGVGRYTTGAVLSICFDTPLPVLDGNVARVLSRLFALEASVRDPRGARRLWDVATRLVPMHDPGDWNQSLMELGARVCVPRNPRCGECPVRGSCAARRLGRQHALPPVPPRRRPTEVRRAMVLVARRGRLLMVPRDGALLGGLWEPPGVELADGEDARRALRRVLSGLGVRVRLSATATGERRVMTPRLEVIEVWRGTPAAGHPAASGAPRAARARYVDVARPVVPLTALARRLAGLS